MKNYNILEIQMRIASVVFLVGIVLMLCVCSSLGVIPGDLNDDDIVDIHDVAIWASAFGSSSGDGNWNPDADLNTDGLIDIFDGIIIILNFG
jgi:hypothetical protein